VLIAVLVGASIGSWIGGIFGGFVAALLAIPAAGAFQVIVREAWRLSGPPLREVPDAADTDSDPEPIAGTAAAEAEDEAEDEAATGSETISANQRE
jgi:hypothetical protein